MGEYRNRPLEGQEEQLLDEWVSFGFIARGTIEDFLDISRYIKKRALLVYETKSAGKLWIVKRREGGEN